MRLLIQLTRGCAMLWFFLLALVAGALFWPAVIPVLVVAFVVDLAFQHAERSLA